MKIVASRELRESRLNKVAQSRNEMRCVIADHNLSNDGSRRPPPRTVHSSNPEKDTKITCTMRKFGLEKIIVMKDNWNVRDMMMMIWWNGRKRRRADWYNVEWVKWVHYWDWVFWWENLQIQKFIFQNGFQFHIQECKVFFSSKYYWEFNLKFYDFYCFQFFEWQIYKISQSESYRVYRNRITVVWIRITVVWSSDFRIQRQNTQDDVNVYDCTQKV